MDVLARMEAHPLERMFLMRRRAGIAHVHGEVAAPPVCRRSLTTARAAAAVSASVPLILLFAGEGPLRRELERAGGHAAETNVRLLGYRSDVRRVLAAADFFVLSSDREGLPFAVLEAMALGLAPVVSDAAGRVEAVGDAGIVVPRGDWPALAEAFRRLAEDPAERARLGAKSRERVSRLFAADRMVERTRLVYDEILEERPRRTRPRRAGLMGDRGFEPRTSALSERRSNQLS